MPPISETTRGQAIVLARKAEALHAVSKAKQGADADLHEMIRNLINAVKLLGGDQSPLVE